jgi:hypothetical protein
MSNNSSMSMSPEMSVGSPTPSLMSSDGASPARPTSVKVEVVDTQLLDMHQLQTGAYTPVAPGYEELTPLSPEDEELLDAIAWWQQN